MKKFFTFTSMEIASAFKHIYAKTFCQGLRLLETTLHQDNDGTYGKLLIITPRACGKAHERNLIKRQLRSIFYEEKLYQKPVTWILFVQKQAIGLSFEQLKQFLCKSMQ